MKIIKTIKLENTENEILYWLARHEKDRIFEILLKKYVKHPMPEDVRIKYVKKLNLVLSILEKLEGEY